LSEYSISINVVARHSLVPQSEIVAELAWVPINAWSAGDGRVTPAGTKMPGTRTETMCAFRFETIDESGTSALTGVLEHLAVRRDFIKRFVNGGGEFAINIGFNGTSGSAFEISPSRLCEMGMLGVRLSVECFPAG
jgi:hypothetical protein